MARNITAQLAEGVTSVSMRHSIAHEGFRMVPCNLGMAGTGDVQMEKLNAHMQTRHELNEGGEGKGNG